MSYAYDHFSWRTVAQELTSVGQWREPGAPLPDFDLPTIDEGRLCRSDLQGRPALIVLVSAT